MCHRDEVLIYSSGFVFQQIRKIKVSIYWLHVHFNCGKVGRLYYDEATKNFREGKTAIGNERPEFGCVDVCEALKVNLHFIPAKTHVIAVAQCRMLLPPLSL